jgi:hypothetical protein
LGAGRIDAAQLAETCGIYDRLAVVSNAVRHRDCPRRYRRLNTIFERSKDHLIAFISIGFISILARRLKRLVTEKEKLSA